jgi:hypothetical protein
MRCNAWAWIISFGVSSIASVPALAQPLSAKTQSIESIVANADLVFIGKLFDFRRAEESHDRDEHEITIAIEETVKQKPYPFQHEVHPKFRCRIVRPASVLANWKKHSSRVLVALDSDVPQNSSVIELTPDKLEVMSADVRLIRDPEAVIELARKAVHRLPANIKRVYTFELQVPREVVAGTSWETAYQTSGHLRLSVPVDQYLEKRAQESVRSKDPERRSEGVAALAYFKSDENLALVRPLLNDADVTYFGLGKDGKPVERVYGVRHAAYQTLKTWGIDVKEPVIREAVR